MDGALPQFGVGQHVPRAEDPRLLRGEGRYTDDVNLPGQAHAVFVTSPVAHGMLRAIDLTAARAMPGVLGIYTADDLERAGIGGIKAWIQPNTFHRDGTPVTAPVRPPLAAGRVRYVGEPVAVVVAESVAQAKDAAEAVALDIVPLPILATVEQALAPGAPALHEAHPGNLAFDYAMGDAAAVEAAFARAAHVTLLDLAHNRLVANTMEPRSAIAAYDVAEDKWTIHVVGQGVLLTRGMLANEILHVPPEKVRVLTGNVGGSFGLKGTLFVEYPSLFLAARALGRPVKWTDERSGSFLSDHHARAMRGTAELALDAEGNFLAWRLTGTANAGAFMVMCGPIANAARHMMSVYRTPAVHFAMRMVYTNTGPMSALRGAGRPEGIYFMERLVDQAAYELGLDGRDLRRRNFVRPEQMPFRNAAGTTYDCGQFAAVMDDAAARADLPGFAARRAASEAGGRLRGLGLCTFVEISGAGAGELGGIHFEADGTVSILSGTHDHGQGHASPFAQILFDRLGIPPDRLRLRQGDSDEVRIGGFTGGSRSAIATGSALVESAAVVVESGRKLAAHILEAAEADIRFADGRFTIAGTDRSIGLLEIADRLHRGLVVPAELPRTLDVHRISTGGYPSTYPNGCHVAEVEIDRETGEVTVASYHSVDDCGVLLNPPIVEGQIQGGVVMGIGQALFEQALFDGEGQLLTGSLMDYALPRADLVPSIATESHPVPTATNPLGVKGCGEAGVSGALPAIMNAVHDALRPLGAPAIDMPATPAKVWAALRAAGKV